MLADAAEAASQRLSLVLFLLVFRKLPFDGTTGEIIGQIINCEPKIPVEAKGEVDRDLRTIILKCLQTDPDLRYQNALELHNDLQLYLAGKPIVARPIGITGRVWTWSRRHPYVTTLVAAMILLVMFAGGVATQLSRVTAERDRARSAVGIAGTGIGQPSPENRRDGGDFLAQSCLWVVV